MITSTKYDPAEIEDKWYKYWLDHKMFKSVPDEREPYTIVIPPPNVTGVLHMGHMLNNTIQDVLIRRAKMMGKNACWVPGTDHASIATEAKVVAKLRAEGIDKNTLTRDEFLKHAWDWTHKHGGIILEQLKKLGASCDWDRTKFTMDESLSESVIQVFIDLYGKGLIYRGVRMVNWDPQAMTAVSDEEVIYTEEQSKLYYVRYKIEGEENYVTIATTRPETILGDTAVCVNPDDERYAHLKGKKVIVPMVKRVVPLIFDEYVDPEFGTGALKITPAHDINDYEIGIRHNLATIDIFNDNGTLSNAAELFIGVDRFAARDLACKMLEEELAMVKIENYNNKVGRSERTTAVIEPKLSMQWFLKMEKLSEPALENVLNDNITIYPEKYKNTYRHWMENVRDWCISRQLWWGHRIPAYYLPDGKFVVAKNDDEALTKAKEISGNQNLTMKDLRQDSDVLDTWFSSWLWPISVFDGIRNPNNPDIKYYYPTNDLVTAPEILFFWVARMIIAGYEYIGEKPFKNVYLTGIVRDAQRRKMSKQLGNSPDPIELMQKYSADGVRVGMLYCSPAGGDLLFDESLTEQGRNFSNKIWNASRLVLGWEADANAEQPFYAKLAVKWFKNYLNQTIETLNKQFEEYRLSEALMTVYKLFRDEFSSWYLEIVKPPYQTAIDAKTLQESKEIFTDLLKLLHPFMPFITEEIWHSFEDRKEGESIMLTRMPEAGKYDLEVIEYFEQAKEIISQIRNIRKEKNIPFKEQIEMFVKSTDSDEIPYESVIMKLGAVSSVTVTDDKIEGSVQFIVKQAEYFIPLANKINVEEEIEKLQKELEYAEGFLFTVMKKLGNERFVENAAPAILEKENAKRADAEAKISALQMQIESYKGVV